MADAQVSAHHENIKLVHKTAHVLGFDLDPAPLPGVGPVHRLGVLHHDSLLATVYSVVQGVSTLLAVMVYQNTSLSMLFKNTHIKSSLHFIFLYLL